MLKGINLYFSEKMPLEKRIKLVKDAGFDGVLMSYPDPEETDQKWLKKTLDGCGLKVLMIHARYDEKTLDKFWEKGEIGDMVEADYARQIANCKFFAPVDMVFHFGASKNSKFTKIGKERISRLLQIAKGKDIRVCSENLYLDDMQNEILRSFGQKNIKMCYDCGHENFLTPNAKFLENFGEYVVQTHLHNNNGQLDQHKPLDEGIIDYDIIAKRLAKLDKIPPLCLEVRKNDNRRVANFLREQKESLDKLEAKILEYKKSL